MLEALGLAVVFMASISGVALGFIEMVTAKTWRKRKNWLPLMVFCLCAYGGALWYLSNVKPW